MYMYIGGASAEYNSFTHNHCHTHTHTPKGFLGMEATVEEELGGKLDTQHSQFLQLSLRGRGRGAEIREGDG